MGHGRAGSGGGSGCPSQSLEGLTLPSPRSGARMARVGADRCAARRSRTTHRLPGANDGSQVKRGQGLIPLGAQSSQFSDSLSDPPESPYESTVEAKGRRFDPGPGHCVGSSGEALSRTGTSWDCFRGIRSSVTGAGPGVIPRAHDPMQSAPSQPDAGVPSRPCTARCRRPPLALAALAQDMAGPGPMAPRPRGRRSAQPRGRVGGQAPRIVSIPWRDGLGRLRLRDSAAPAFRRTNALTRRSECGSRAGHARSVRPRSRTAPALAARGRDSW